MNTESYPVETAAPMGHTTSAATAGLPSRASGLESSELGTFWLPNGAPVPFVAAPRPAELPAVENVDQMRQIERIESVERLKAVVSHEVNVLKAAGAGSLAVMLRPDADTELFVQLTRSGDKIDAFVRLEKGNSAELRQNWDQLQASLGNQQIRLLPLQSSDFNQQSQRQTTHHDGHDFQDPARNGASRDSAGFGRQSRGEQGNPGEGHARRQPVLVGSSTDALPVSPRLAHSGRGHRHLETWA